MQTQTLVRASADVVTITTLRRGDVYKRLTKGWNGEYSATFGVVQTVDQNGEAAMVSSLEISAGKVEHKVFGTETDLQIFDTTPEEVENALVEHEQSLRTKHRTAVEEVQKAQQAIEQFARLRSQIDMGEAQRPTTVVTSTAQEITA